MVNKFILHRQKYVQYIQCLFNSALNLYTWNYLYILMNFKMKIHTFVNQLNVDCTKFHSLKDNFDFSLSSTFRMSNLKRGYRNYKTKMTLSIFTSQYNP